MKRTVFYRLDDEDAQLRGELERLPGFAGVLPEFKPGERHRKTLNALLANDDVSQQRMFEFMDALNNLADQLEAIMDLIPQVKPDRLRQIQTCKEINEELAKAITEMEAV